MRILDHLSDNTKKRLKEMKIDMHQPPSSKKKARRSRKKRKEKLSLKDIEHMMGTFKNTLHRGKGGAWK